MADIELVKCWKNGLLNSLQAESSAELFVSFTASGSEKIAHYTAQNSINKMKSVRNSEPLFIGVS